MALPLALRNRLAELILDAFDQAEARRTLEALVAFCRNPAGRLEPEAEARLTALGWFQPRESGGLALHRVHQAHLSALCRRVEGAAAVFRDPAATADSGTLPGLLARAARLADSGLFFEVHELIEPVWMRAEGAERVALQGLIQIAVAFHHAENGNREGAVSLLTEGLAKLGAAGSVLPLDTAPWQSKLAATLTALREGGPLAIVSSWPTPQTPKETAWRSS